MARGQAWYLVAPLVALGLVGCRIFDYEEREPWRAQAEAQCLAEGMIQPSSFVEPVSAINGRGTCGMTRPLKVAALSQGFVTVSPEATLACPITANVEAWFEEAVQPAAFAWFGEPVVEIRQISAYSCRTMNGQPGASISEHAFGNALDIATFKLESGREVKVQHGWRGKPEERGFLRNIHAAACERFTTVLAPGADMFHYDHIHVDLSRRPSGRSVCRPGPQMIEPPPVSRGVPMVQAPQPAPARMPASAQARAGDSPWAQRAPESARGPTVIERAPGQQAVRAAGEPLVLGPQAPPPNSFGTPLSLDERLQRSFGQPVGRGGGSRPNRLTPPAAVPQAQHGGDPVVTGSIGAEAEKTSEPEAALLRQPSITELKRFNSEPASVFNLPGRND